jgi:hypothetical protein
MPIETLEHFKSEVIKNNGMKESDFTIGLWQCMFLTYKKKKNRLPTRHELHVAHITSDDHLQGVYKRHIPDHDFHIFENSRPETNTCITSHKGVLYAINSTSGTLHLNKPEIALENLMLDRASLFHEIIENHHRTIRTIYDYFLSISQGAVWCKIECGRYVVFGNDGGDLAHMRLPHIRSGAKSNIIYELTPQGENMTHCFNNMPHIDQVKLNIYP